MLKMCSVGGTICIILVLYRITWTSNQAITYDVKGVQVLIFIHRDIQLDVDITFYV